MRILLRYDKYDRKLYLIILLFIVTVFIQSVFVFILRHGWSQDGWKVFAIEDSDMYYPMSEIFEKKGLFYDGEEINEDIRSRMPVYPLFILAAKKIALNFGWFSPPPQIHNHLKYTALCGGMRFFIFICLIVIK